MCTCIICNFKIKIFSFSIFNKCKTFFFYSRQRDVLSNSYSNLKLTFTSVHCNISFLFSLLYLINIWKPCFFAPSVSEMNLLIFWTSAGLGMDMYSYIQKVEVPGSSLNFRFWGIFCQTKQRYKPSSSYIYIYINTLVRSQI